MSDVLSFAEIEGQQVELLPARTVMSLFSAGGSGSSLGGQTGTGTATATATATATTGSPSGSGVMGGSGVPSGSGVMGGSGVPSSAGVMGGPGGQGGAGTGLAGFWHNLIYIEGDMDNTLVGGQGGAADGGPATSNTSMGTTGH
jgi:hypothetical protein